MNRAQSNSRFLARAREAGWLEGLELSYLDVGASGGLDSFWRQFEPQFRAVGFDPLQTEVDRLNRLEHNPNVTYEACWVGSGSQYEPLGNDIETGSYFSLTSADRALKASNQDYVKEQFNRGEEVRLAEQRIGIDSWLSKSGFGNVDVLKSDTDSADFGVLESAQRLLSEGTVLAIITECQFHEPIGQRAPVFSEIDRFLRDCGYRLFDMDVWHYTRSSLPGPFLFDIFAQTTRGQIQFCDALYMLDPVADVRAYQRLMSLQDTTKLAKLILLYEALGLPDCAAALLEKIRVEDVMAGQIDIPKALNWLVPDNPWGAADHATYLSEFDRDPSALFPSRASLIKGKEAESIFKQVKKLLSRAKKSVLSRV